MNKLEVGMYVETKLNYIRRIIKVISNYEEFDVYEVDMEFRESEYYESTEFLYPDEVINSSFNPIDLIGVGDYVNGMEVMNISDFKDGSRYIEFDEGRYLCKNYQIKSIVTKEQFSSMEYRLGDK